MFCFFFFNVVGSSIQPVSSIVISPDDKNIYMAVPETNSNCESMWTIEIQEEANAATLTGNAFSDVVISQGSVTGKLKESLPIRVYQGGPIKKLQREDCQSCPNHMGGLGLSCWCVVIKIKDTSGGDWVSDVDLVVGGKTIAHSNIKFVTGKICAPYILSWDRDLTTGALSNQVATSGSNLMMKYGQTISISPSGNHLYLVGMQYAGNGDEENHQIVYWERSDDGKLTNPTTITDLNPTTMPPPNRFGFNHKDHFGEWNNIMAPDGR